jgi:drug/metabolite transporter (DMT)-like permease
MATYRDNLVGIVAMTASTAAFIANDTLVKLTSDDLPLGEIIFIRSVIAVTLVGVIIAVTGDWRNWRMAGNPAVGLRTLGEVAATILYLTALFNMPIANSTTILQVVPLAATAGGAIFLGDRVGWRRWTAILVGFLGVLIVVRPGLAGFDAYALLVLAAMLFVTLRDLATRAIPNAMPTLLVTFVSLVALLVTGAALGLGETWVMPDGRHLLMLAGAAIVLSAGFVTIIVALRIGDMATVAPFRYSNIIWAIVIGFVVWNEVPDAFMLLGTALIIGTGVYTFYRERALRKAGRPVPEVSEAVPVAPPLREEG